MTTYGRRSANTDLTGSLRPAAMEMAPSVEKLFWSEMYQRMLEPAVDVQATTGGRTDRYRARTLSDAEAEAAWPKLIAVYPTFARYRRRARRTIPVIELRRDVGDGSPLPA